jgi:hypothetical protein
MKGDMGVCVLRGYVSSGTICINQAQHIKNTKACILPSRIVNMQTINRYSQTQQSGKQSFHKAQFIEIHNKQMQPAPKQLLNRTHLQAASHVVTQTA